MKSTTKAGRASGQFQRTLLASACVLAMGAPAAFAQTTTYGFTAATPAATVANATGYLITTLNNQFNSGTPVAASLLNDDFVSVSVGGAGSPFVVTANSTSASSVANNVYNNGTGALALLQNLPPKDGIAIQSSQVRGNTTPVVTAATISASDTGVNLTNQGTGSVTVNANSIVATTQLNQAASTLSGAVPVGYASGTDGASVTTYNGGTGDATSSGSGGVAIGNSQVSLNAGQRAGSSATVTGSNVAVTIAASAAWADPVSVTGNTIAASYGANDATNTIAASAGSAPFAGAAVIGNLQVNRETADGTPATSTASVTGSSVNAAVRSGLGVPMTVSSTLDVSGNGISATSTGNSVQNTIAFGALADVAGTGTVPSNSLSATSADTLAATVAGDLAISSVQTNQNTRLLSDLTGNSVTATADLTTSTGAITVNNNTLSAQGTGNKATSAISTDPSAANFTGSASAGNLQTNATTTDVLVRSTNSGSTVGVAVGYTNASVLGTLTANGNELSAAATGSAASTSVDLAAGNVTLTGVAAPGGSAVSGAAAPTASGSGGATATNLQASYGGGSDVRSLLTGGSVSINIVDQNGDPANLATSTLSVNANNLLATSASNTAATGVSLAGTNVSGTAATANSQYSANPVVARTIDSGVGISAQAFVSGATLSVNDNTVAAAATGNAADNTLDVAGTNVTAGAVALAGTSGTVATGTRTASSSAAFSVTSSQTNAGDLRAANLSASYARIEAGAADFALTGSNLSVNDNVASAATTGNQVSNALTIDAANLAVAGGTAGKVGAVTSLQTVNAASTSVTTLGPNALSSTPQIGISYGGATTSSNLTVSGNQADAVSLGNTATNGLSVTGSNFVAAGGAGGNITSANGTSSVLAPFALINRQNDLSASRTATVQNMIVGIDDSSPAGLVGGVNMTVTGNRVVAEARNNNAVNTVDLNGFANLSAGASALNRQSSGADVSAVVDNARVRVQATGSTVAGSNLTVTDNTITGLAVGNSGSTVMTADASNQLAGNATIAAASAGASINATTGVVTLNADYGVANAQTMTGAVNASVLATARVQLNNSDVGGGSATLSGNAINAVAQANSGVAGITLSAPNVATSAAVASYQSATGAVSATALTQADQNASFEIRANTASSAPLVVSGNRLVASAGQNEAVTVLDASAVVLAGRSFSNQFTGYVSPTATASADFTATNVQSGVGNVTATAVPGLVGVNIDTINGGSAVVNNNAVAARAAVNSASNTVNLSGSSSLNATGAINNVQTSTAGVAPVSATVGDGVVPTSIGLTPNNQPITLNGTTATISGNSLNAVASGNDATNALQATSSGQIAGPGAVGVPTFAVLNTQSNAAAMNATVNTATIGMVSPPAGLVGSVNGSSVSVLNNQVLAAGQGNSASNSLVSSAIAGNGNSASMLLSNTQANTAAISATATAVTIGLSSGAVNGSTSVVSGNSIAAQAIGNTAVNKVTAK